jgi:hypothetical protein
MSFTTSGSLTIHQRTHTRENPYSYNQCDRRYSDKLISMK